MTEEMTEDRAQQLLDAIAAVREALTGRNLTANDVIGVLVASITDGIDQLTRDLPEATWQNEITANVERIAQRMTQQRHQRRAQRASSATH